MIFMVTISYWVCIEVTVVTVYIISEDKMRVKGSKPSNMLRLGSDLEIVNRSMLE